jgi:hypothetical protein
MVTLGAGLLIFGMIGDRLVSMKFGGVEFQLQQAQEFAAFADVELQNGNPDQAAIYRSQALSYLRSSSLLPLANRYESIRSNEPSGAARTATLEQLLMDVRALARQRAWSAGEVAEEFAKGSEGSRITALAVMEELPQLRVFSAIANVLVSPLSKMEQYHALVAAEASVPYLTPEERSRLRAILERLDDTVGGDRQRVLDRVVRALDAVGTDS